MAAFSICVMTFALACVLLSVGDQNIMDTVLKNWIFVVTALTACSIFFAIGVSKYTIVA